MTTETHEFKTELKQLLDIIIHSLYSNKEIFLRELVSNSCDAIDKVRFESLTNPDLLQGDSDWKIKIISEPDAGTITISDNGIGMTRDEVIEHLGTIAKSGTQSFIDNLKSANAEQRPELIGQFGVGFYSSLMVADKVDVVTRAAGEGTKGVRWSTDGKGAYAVDAEVKASRGTDVILHLKDEDKEFLESFRIQSIIKRYSDFVEHPIVMDVEEEKEEDGEKVKEIVEQTLNSQKALWLKSPSEIEEDEYKDFYRHVTHSFDEPLRTIHYTAEGMQEFTALVYLPTKKPFDFYNTEPKSGLSLYIKRVFIMDDCEKLIPPYLRFVKGLVDSSDLPLNVSRELLQDNPMLTKIRGALTKKVLSALTGMKDAYAAAPDAVLEGDDAVLEDNGDDDADAKKDADKAGDYLTLWKEFGPVIKEGVGQDYQNKDKLADLLLFESTKTKPGAFRSLADYVNDMGGDQDEIYYLIGESRDLIEKSPLLETFGDKDQEVLFLTDPIDEWMVPGLGEYREKKLKPIDRGKIEDEAEKSEEKKKAEADFKTLFECLEKHIDEVKAVRISDRLKESAAVLVADEDDMGAHMERLMSKLGRDGDMPASKRILEMNAAHPAVKALKTLFDSDPKNERIESYGRLLYDQAVIAEGSTIKDPQAMAKRINDLLARDATTSENVAETPTKKAPKKVDEEAGDAASKKDGD